MWMEEGVKVQGRREIAGEKARKVREAQRARKPQQGRHTKQH